MVWIPEVDDHAAGRPPAVISRNSERGFRESTVVTPFTGARKATALQALPTEK